MNVLQIPIIYYSIVCICSEFSIKFQNNEYLDMFSNNPEGLNYTILITFCFFVLILLTDAGFTQEPEYTKNSASKVHNIIELKEIFCIIFLTIIRHIVGVVIFLMVFGAVSIYFVHSYFYYLPYMSVELNVLNALLWVEGLISSVLVLISCYYDDFTVFKINFFILFASFSLLTYQVFKKRVEYLTTLQRSRDPFINELKFRFFLFSLKMPLTENNKQTIFDHFDYVTTHFYDFQLQYL